VGAPVSEVDFSGAYNDFGGSNNAFNEFNSAAFAAIKGNGSIMGAFVPPRFESPHATIEPSVLRAAKACLFE
jgi:hypothetical protein